MDVSGAVLISSSDFDLISHPSSQPSYFSALPVVNLAYDTILTWS